MNLDVALSILLAVTAVCYMLLGGRLVVGKREVGTAPIGTLLVVIGLWVLGGAIELAATNFQIFSIGRTGHFVGTALVPIVAYVCFREYTGRETSGHRIVLLMIIPIVSITLAATNVFHEFMWYLPIANDAGEFLTRPKQWGPWFLFIHAPYSYLLFTAALLTLLTHSSAVARAHRRGLFMLAAACLAPLGATVAYDIGFGPNTVSFVPFVFTLMLPIYAWLIIGEQIVELTPLAYETVFQNMQDPVVVVDEHGRIIGLNYCAESLLDITETSALLEPLEMILRGEAPEIFAALDTGKPQKMMTGTGRFLHIQVSPLKGNRPSVREGKVLMFRDVSDVEKAQAEVRNSEKLLRTLIDHSVNGIIRLRWVQGDEDAEKTLRCIFANSAATRFLNTDAETLNDVVAEEMLRLATAGMKDVEVDDILRQFQSAVENGATLDIEFQQYHNNSSRWLRMICQPVGDDIAATFVDVTDGKAKEHKMESIAWSDPMTGVLNRRGFERDAARRLTESNDDATGALLFIDLNGFKKINDSLGHEIGDQLLRIAAQRLQKSLRSCDIIGRPGGDEFVALVPDVSAQTADMLATRLTDALEQAYMIGPHELQCAASIGLARYPQNASTLTGLMREADQAMYRAKARCRDASDIQKGDLLEKAM